MYKILLTFCLFISLSSNAQKRELTYSLSNVPIFLNEAGDTLNKALIGGVNQPQFQSLDINNDGKKDLIIHDRTGGMMLPFINIGKPGIENYIYSPKYVSAFPKIKNGWMLLKDYDNDGKEDLWANINFVTVLLKNVTATGDKQVKFIQVAELKAHNFYPPPFDSSNFSCDFFNIPTVGDVDGDGDIDLFSYQANVGQLLLYRNMTKDFNLPLHPPTFDLADFCWGDFIDTTFDGVSLLGCPYKIYRKHTGGSTLLWFDNDNDGDMDLLMGNAGGKNLIFLKNGKKDLNLVYDSMISYVGHWPDNSTPLALKTFPAAFMLDADGDGNNDIIVAPNQYDNSYFIEETEQVWFYKNYGSNTFPDFKFEKKNFFTDNFLDHGAYTAPILQDIDSDSDLDLILATNGGNSKTGDKTDRLVLYRNIGTTKRPVFKLESTDLWGISVDSLTSLAITFGDLNGDNKMDLLAGNSEGNLYFYKNIGTNTSWAFATPTKNYLNINVGENSSPQLIDIDKNGLLDLVLGQWDGNFNYYKNTGNTGSPVFTLVDDTLGNFRVNEMRLDRNPPQLDYFGNAAGEIADLDGDGKWDMIFGGEEGKVRVMKFNDISQQAFTEDTLVLFDSAYNRYTTMDFGARTRPATGDIDGDGIRDVIVGNTRGGIHFLKGAVKILSTTDIYKRNEPIVYPNPANGSILNINKRSDEAFSFYLYDMTGKLVIKEISEAGNSVFQLSLSNISNGMYLLQSVDANGKSYNTRISVLKK